MMSEDVELRKIAGELKELNKNLFHMTRALTDIAKTLKYDDSKIGQDQIPKMVEDLSAVSETPRKPQSEYEKMQAAIREHNDQRRYQKREE